MKTVLVRYKIREGLVSENEALIHPVFEQLRRDRPIGLQYRTYKLADDCSFVHLAQIDTIDASNPLAALESFKQFQRGLRDRCIEPPVAVELNPLDEYTSPARS